MVFVGTVVRNWEVERGRRESGVGRRGLGGSTAGYVSTCCLLFRDTPVPKPPAVPLLRPGLQTPHTTSFRAQSRNLNLALDPPAHPSRFPPADMYPPLPLVVLNSFQHPRRNPKRGLPVSLRPGRTAVALAADARRVRGVSAPPEAFAEEIRKARVIRPYDLCQLPCLRLVAIG